MLEIEIILGKELLRENRRKYCIGNDGEQIALEVYRFLPA